MSQTFLDKHRDRAILIDGRVFVPTSHNTEWVHDWPEFEAAGGVLCFSEDQTEVTLSLPAGFKFGIRFLSKAA